MKDCTPKTFVIVLTTTILLFNSATSTSISWESGETAVNETSDANADKCLLARSPGITDLELDELQKCYVKRNYEEDIMTLLNINPRSYSTAPFDKRYDLAVKNLCSVWPQNLKCLFDYIKDDCNEDQIGVLKRTLLLIPEMYMTSTLCDGSYQELYRGIAEDGLGSCYVKDLVSKKIGRCSRNTEFPGINKTPGFKTYIMEWFDCVKPGLQVCAGDFPEKARELMALWDRIQEAFIQVQDKVWREFALY